MSGAVAQKTGSPEIPVIGQVLDDRFELLARLGDGGMGHVFRARDRKLGREIALKLINPRYLQRPERIQRFFREQELNQRVPRYPYLVDVVDGGRLRNFDWPFLVMELVGSTELDIHLVHNGRLPPRQAARIARQVAGALRALHAANVVHRDVNATNIMMQGNDGVLIDLSHAGDADAPQVAAGEAGRLTQAHEFPGTHHYMSREQSWAAPAHPTMDIYAYGITLIHMLTGHSPHGAGREAFLELSRQGKISPFRVDVRVYDDVPARFADLAHACIVDDPASRPTAEEIVRELDEILAAMSMPPVEERVKSRVVAVPLAVASVASNVASPVPAPIVAVSEDQPAETFPRKRVLIGVAVAVVVAIVALALVWSPSDGGESAPETKAIQPTDGESPAAAEIGPPAEVEPPATVKVEPPTAEHEPPSIVAAEPEPEPRRKVKAKAKRKTKPKQVRGDAKGGDDAKPDKPQVDPSSDECEAKRNAAKSAGAGRDWATVLKTTKATGCWHRQSSRNALRVQALHGLGKYRECIEAGRSAQGTQAQRTARLCELALNERP